MAERALLHKEKFDAFVAWLDEKNIPHRPGKGTYQKLQVLVHNGWKCIYWRNDMPEHLTIQDGLTGLVHKFIKSTKKAKVCPNCIKLQKELDELKFRMESLEK